MHFYREVIFFLTNSISYYNNLIFKDSMELHVDEIIIILLDVLKQHVRFFRQNAFCFTPI